MAENEKIEIVVSVIIPAFNSGKYIVKAIESALKQEVPLEVIVIDDASEDNTKSLLSRYSGLPNFRYVRNKSNCGVSESRNTGIGISRGKYIAFLDADDWWAHNKLSKQVKLMQKTGCALSYSGRELYTDNGKALNKIIKVPKVMDYSKLLKTNLIACSSVVVRKEAIKAIPMEHDEIHEDYLEWLRILRKYGKAYGVNEPLLKTRLTRDGRSRKRWKTFKKTYYVYRYLGLGKLKSFYYMCSHVLRSGLRYHLS